MCVKCCQLPTLHCRIVNCYYQTSLPSSLPSFLLSSLTNSPSQLSGCAICGLGLWTLLEKGDFIQLLTNSTYQVKRTMMMIRTKCMMVMMEMKKEDTENKSNRTNDVARQQHGFQWRLESFQSSQLCLVTLQLPWRVDVSLHRFVMMMAMMMSSYDEDDDVR